jgi:hypothetical protein
MRSEQGRVVVKARPTFVPVEQEALGESISLPSPGKVNIAIHYILRSCRPARFAAQSSTATGTAAAVHTTLHVVQPLLL